MVMSMMRVRRRVIVFVWVFRRRIRGVRIVRVRAARVGFWVMRSAIGGERR